MIGCDWSISFLTGVFATVMALGFGFIGYVVLKGWIRDTIRDEVKKK